MDPYRPQPRRRVDNSVIPTVIFVLLVANGLMFAVQNFAGGPEEAGIAGGIGRLVAYSYLWTLSSGLFQPLQLVSYAFLHGDTSHLLFNMFQLWMFGRDVERVWGPKRFAIYYFVCVIGAALFQLVVAAMQGGTYPTLGASGGVFGILLAYGMLFPNRQVMLLFPPIPMKAKYMVILFGAMELYLGLSGSSPGIANFAHLGGMLFGFLLIQHWRTDSRGRR